MMQGADLHARHLERGDACIPPSQCPALPEPLHGQGEGPPSTHGKHCFKPVGNKHRIGYQSQPQHLNAKSGDTRACIPHTPDCRLCAADTYKEDISQAW